MLLRPINAYPSNNVSVDANEEVVFYSMIEGSASVVSKYRYMIYDAYTHGVLYQETVDLSSKPLLAGDELKYSIRLADHGVNNNRNCYWRLRLYQEIADMFVTNSVIQDKSEGTTIYIRAHNNVEAGMYLNINGVSKLITEYLLSEDGSVGICIIESEFTEFTVGGSCTIYKNYVDSLQFPFYTQPTPTLTISADGVKDGIVSTRKLNFTLEYSALHEMPIKWYRVVVTDADTGKVFDDSDKVYNSGLSYQSEGFLNEHTYSVVGYVFNSNNMLLSTSNECVVTAQYNAPSMAVVPRVGQNKIDDSVIVSWDQDRVSVPEKLPGAVETFTDEGMRLEGNAIVYNMLSSRPLDLGDAWTIFVDATISNINHGNIIMHNDSGSRLYIDANNLKYDTADKETIMLGTVLPDVCSGQQPYPSIMYKEKRTIPFQLNPQMNQLMTVQYRRLDVDMRGKVIYLTAQDESKESTQRITIPESSIWNFSAITNLTISEIASQWEYLLNTYFPSYGIKVTADLETDDNNAHSGRAKLIIYTTGTPGATLRSIPAGNSAFPAVGIPDDGTNKCNFDTTIKVFTGATSKTFDVTLNGVTKSFDIQTTVRDFIHNFADEFPGFVMYLWENNEYASLGITDSSIKEINISDNIQFMESLGLEDKLYGGSLPLNTNYIWMDDEEWDDSLYWVDTPEFTKRYKITMQPRYAQVMEVV